MKGNYKKGKIRDSNTSNKEGRKKAENSTVYRTKAAEKARNQWSIDVV